VTLLGSLPPSFSVVATAPEAPGDNQIVCSQAQQSLILEKMKLAKLNRSSMEHQQWLVHKEKPPCYYCGQMGHF